MNALRGICPSHGRYHVTRYERDVSHKSGTHGKFFFRKFPRPSQASDVAHIKLENRQMKDDKKSSIMLTFPETLARSNDDVETEVGWKPDVMLWF